MGSLTGSINISLLTLHNCVYDGLYTYRRNKLELSSVQFLKCATSWGYKWPKPTLVTYFSKSQLLH